MADWNVIRLESTSSTNDDAARSGAAWDVFVAREQTGGRGRIGHKWHSAPGMDLAMTAVLPVGGLDFARAATLPVAIGLAVARFVASRLGNATSGGATRAVALKWPNDVIAGGRKIAGILCERRGDNVCAGIGLNVRTRVFPPDIAARAVSLSLLGCETGPEEALHGVLDEIARLWAAWRENGLGDFMDEISSIDWLKGSVVEVTQTDGDRSPVRGLCSGISPDGALVVGGRKIWAGEGVRA